MYKEVEIMNEIKYKPIGVIHSLFKEPEGTPIQPAAAKSIDGTVEVFEEYAEGLKDIEGFSHIILIYHFHLSKGSLLKVKPYMDNEVHGVFATRAPSRPNSIGISIVRLVGTPCRGGRECTSYSRCRHYRRNSPFGYKTLCSRI